MNDLALKAGRYRFYFEVTEAFDLPAFYGSTLRGAFGWALMRLGDVSKKDIQQQTPNYIHSAYAAVFEPPRLAQKNDLGRLSDRFVPYVLRVPYTMARTYTEGEIFSFEMVLMGEALQHLQTVILAWQQLFLRGLSAHKKGKAKLMRVVCCNKQPHSVVYSAEHPLVQSHQARLQAPVFEQVENLQLTFFSPLRLQYKGKVLSAKEITVDLLLRNIIRRVSICAHAQQQSISIEKIRHLNELADTVTAQPFLFQQNWQRYSNRQNKRMDLNGVMGGLHIPSLPRELLPIVWLGQFLHVGKNTSLGFGNYGISTSL